jgi:hypothetical protein
MIRLSVLFIVSTVVLTACAGHQSLQTPVANEYELAVTFEEQDKGSTVGQKFEHPYQVDIDVLKQLMADLRYIDESGAMTKKEEKAVFQGDEIDRLAPVLVGTLAEANAGQSVRFVSFNQAKSAIFSKSQKTEGVIFVASGAQLNLAFNYINANRAPSETSATYHKYSKIDPLKIKTAVTALSVTAGYTELHRFTDGSQAPMWLIADLNKLQEAVATKPVPTVKPAETLAPAIATKTETTNTPVAQSAHAVSSDDPQQVEIKDKLKFLKELLDEGLISEQDYNSKKLELLDKIH